MTTPLDKPVSRLSYAMKRSAGKLRRVVVTLAPGDVIIFRDQGTRRELMLSIEGAYTYAAKCKADQIRRERAQRRRGDRYWYRALVDWPHR